jgi:hypothetical protein
MDNWNNLTYPAKLAAWKELRDRIKDNSLDVQLAEIVKFFAQFPFGKRMIDFYTPSTWPTPWDLVNYDKHCYNTISVLMYYTCRFLNINDIEMYIIDDNADIFIVPVIGGKYMLNYVIGEVMSLEDMNEYRIISILKNTDITQY